MSADNVKKLGLGIVAFDDTIHLRNITAEIRDLCDVILICLQKTSYHGDPINQEIVEQCEKLQNDGLVDKIVWFEEKEITIEHEERETPRLIETDKRNFILDCLEAEGCTYAHVIDSDEFYDHDDYQKAKEVVYGNPELHVTYCEYLNYYRDYCHVMVWPYRCFVPFITEIGYKFDFKNGSFDKPSDPTRRYRIDKEGAKYCIFNFKTVKMHHLSWIRTNIEDKIDNWSSRKYFEEYDKLKERIIDRYNNYKDGQNAIIMFATPNNEVVVNKLPAQYIHPKYPLF